MQVSFGKIKYENELKAKTDKQQLIEDLVTNYFLSKKGKEPSLKTVIKRDLSADILVKHTKDGNTTISLVSTKDKTKLPFIPSLEIPNRLFIFKIGEMIENFGETCKIIAEVAKKEQKH